MQVRAVQRVARIFIGVIDLIERESVHKFSILGPAGWLYNIPFFYVYRYVAFLASSDTCTRVRVLIDLSSHLIGVETFRRGCNETLALHTKDTTCINIDLVID